MNEHKRELEDQLVTVLKNRLVQKLEFPDNEPYSTYHDIALRVYKHEIEYSYGRSSYRMHGRYYADYDGDKDFLVHWYDDTYNYTDAYNIDVIDKLWPLMTDGKESDKFYNDFPIQIRPRDMEREMVCPNCHSQLTRRPFQSLYIFNVGKYLCPECGSEYDTEDMARQCCLDLDYYMYCEICQEAFLSQHEVKRQWALNRDCLYRVNPEFNLLAAHGAKDFPSVVHYGSYYIRGRPRDFDSMIGEYAFILQVLKGMKNEGREDFLELAQHPEDFLDETRIVFER